MTTHREHSAFQNRLDEVLGEEHAATLVSMISSRDDLVTNADLDRGLGLLLDELKGGTSQLRDELKGEMSQLRGELREDMRSLESRLDTRMSAFEQGLTSEMGEDRRAFNTSLQAFVRTFVIAQVTTVVGVSGVVLAVVRLL